MRKIKTKLDVCFPEKRKKTRKREDAGGARLYESVKTGLRSVVRAGAARAFACTAYDSSRFLSPSSGKAQKLSRSHSFIESVGSNQFARFFCFLFASFSL